MFGSEKKQQEEEVSDIAVETIPTDFYGGANPIIQFKKTVKEVKIDSASPLTTRERAMFHKATTAGAGESLHPAHLLSNKRFVVVSAAGIFVVCAIGGAWYYTAQYKQEQQNKLLSQVQPGPVVSTPDPVSVAPVVPVIPESTPTPPSSTPKSDSSIDFPSELLAMGPDLDKDGLTDSEEEIFKTDPGVPDTDGDSYSDSHEVYYLYNPSGIAPQKLIDAGQVADFVNPVYDYRVYYPATWALGNVDQNFQSVLFSTITGEYIESSVFDLLPGETFEGWFARSAAGQRFDQLESFYSVFKERGVRRKDKLVYYFTDSKRVYLFIYHTTQNTVANFPNIITMMARSFRLAGNTVEIPLPPALADSTTLSESSLVTTTTSTSPLAISTSTFVSTSSR